MTTGPDVDPRSVIPWFRRDLRSADNPALNRALAAVKDIDSSKSEA